MLVAVPASTVPTVSVPADPPLVSARFEGGVYTLRGTVADELQRNQLLLSAAAVVRPDNIVDELVVDLSSPVDAATSDVLAALIRATPPNLVSGESGVDGSTVYSAGVFRDAAGRAAFESVAADLGVEPLLTARPDGEVCDTAAVAAALNDEVARQPVQFRSGSATIAPESAALLDRVAALAVQCGGVTVAVTGHTDTSGDASTNQVLSEQRAAAVVAALVDRGVPPESLVADGAGERDPIVVDGVEDQSASRRVEFTVTVA